MKTIFISILSKSISDDDFGAFWSGLIHTSLAHHLKIQVQLEVNGKVCHKLAEVTESDFDVATQLTSSDDESVFFKSIKYIGSGLKNVPSSSSIELWIISDWTMDDEDAIVDAIDQFQSVRRGIETIYFHAGKENESISAAVTDYYPLSTESCFYAVTRSGETAAGRVSAKKNATFLMFDDDVKVEVDLFRGSKNSPSLSKLVKIESYDETSEQTVKTVTQYTADGMPVDPNDLDIELEIDEETAPVKRGDKSTFQQVFSKDTMSSVTILGFCSLDDGRIPSVSVSTVSCFMYGPRDSQLFHGLLQTCVKKRKGFFLSVRIQKSSQVCKLSFALPNRDLNCFELIDLPCAGQRKNGEKAEELNTSPSDHSITNAKKYIQSLEQTNLKKMHHPIVQRYHEELALLCSKSDVFIPEDRMNKVCPLNPEATALLHTHGIYQELGGDTVKTSKVGMDDTTVRSFCESGNHAKVTVAILKDYCKRKGLPVTGKKSDLISAILQN